MSVIWSFGQVYPDYTHSPSSGIEAGTAENDRFYQPDEIKYHGSRNRGTTSINFFDVDSNANNSDICRGEFSTSCDAQGQSCDYKATWEVQGFNVKFTLTARQMMSGRTEWVAIGFSDNRMMVSHLCIHFNLYFLFRLTISAGLLIFINNEKSTVIINII